LANSHPHLISFILKLIDFHSTNAETPPNDNHSDDADLRYLYLCNQLTFSKWFVHLSLPDFQLMDKWLSLDLNRIKFQILYNCFLTFNFLDIDDGDGDAGDTIEMKVKKIKLLTVLDNLYRWLNQQWDQQDSEKLRQFYTQLTRDNRSKLQTSIWLIIIKLNLNHNLDQLYDQISLIEAREPEANNQDQFKITKFYLSQMKMNAADTKRPLTAYINIVLTSNLHDFDRFLTCDALSLIESLVKQRCKLAAYNLVDLYCFNLVKYACQVNSVVDYNRILNEVLRSTRYMAIVQQLFEDSNDLVEYYFTFTYLNLKRMELNREYRELYLSFVLQTLMAAHVKWYKNKNLLKFFDTLLAYVFIHDNINAFIVKKLLFFVYNDFSNIFTSVESVQQNLLSTYVTWLTNTITNSGPNANESLTQFSYDKSLYREYPYLGMYLSLCEEQIEQDLGK
jgi:hypothetical protein